MIERDEVEQALEIACGDTLGGPSMGSRKTASQRSIDSAREHVRRFLRELPPDLFVHEVLEALNDEQ